MNPETNVTCTACENRNCFIKKCSSDWINRLSSVKAPVTFRRGEYIFREGDQVAGVYFILKGNVKVISTGLNGKEQIVRLATDGHILGHRGYGGEYYPIGAVSLEASRICFFDNEILYEAFQANFDFLYGIMMFYSGELRKSELRTKFFGQMTVDEKVAYALFYIVRMFGLNSRDQTINLVMSRSEIASIIGTNADQVSRSVNFLKSNKIIDTLGKQIKLLDPDGLEKLFSHYSYFAREPDIN